jgi:hypothetical protein
MPSAGSIRIRDAAPYDRIATAFSAFSRNFHPSFPEESGVQRIASTAKGMTSGFRKCPQAAEARTEGARS